MDWKIEVIVMPVADLDRARAFYADRCGFHVDHDTQQAPSSPRIIQLTPPGSGCSIVIGTGMPGTAPGSVQGIQIVVDDIDAAVSQLRGRDVEISDIFHFGAEGQAPGKGGPWNAFATFADPDGNGWVLQERAPAT